MRTADIIASLRSMARAEHNDLGVADEAADEIERLREGLRAIRALTGRNDLLGAWRIADQYLKD